MNNMTKELMARCKKYNFNDELINLINGAEGMFELLREPKHKQYTMLEWIDLGIPKGLREYELTERESFLVALFMLMTNMSNKIKSIEDIRNIRSEK